MMGHAIGHQRRAGGLVRLAVAMALLAAVFVVAPAAEALAVPGVVDFTAGTSNAPEATTPHSVEVALTVGPGDTLDFPFDVDVAVVVATPGTATDGGVDYTYTTQTVTFNAGDDDTARRTVNIAVVDDALDEIDETIEFELTNLVNNGGTSTIGVTQPTHTVTITDDDATPTVSIADAGAVTEGATSSLTVSLSAVSGLDVDVDYTTADVTAEAGRDYTAETDTLTIPAGSPSGTITISTTNDTRDEPAAETFTVTLTTPVVNATLGTPITGTGTINDNDAPPTVSIANAAAVMEGGTSSFTVSLSAESEYHVAVDYATSDLSATAGSDYTAKAGTLTILAGDPSGSVTVNTLTDGLSEPAETFRVTLAIPVVNATLGTPTTGTGTINDGTALPTVSIANAPAVNEGVTSSFTVSLSAVSGQNVDVDYTTADGTALAGSDYTAETDTLTIPAGNLSGTITIDTTNDTRNEAATETFTVTLADPANATLGTPTTGTGTINDNDPEPTISIANGSAVEGAGTMTFDVTLSTASGRTVTVNYATANNTAVAPGDYVAKTGTVTFTPGDVSEQVTVSIVGDSLDEPDDIFRVNLNTPAFATIADGQADGTITDDDPTPTLSVSSPSVEEGLTAVFTVTLSAASGQTVTVNRVTTNGTATEPGDYTALTSALLTFTPGQTTKTVNVVTIEDTTNEANETFTLVLSGATNATIPVPTGTGTIIDDDGPPGLSVVNAAPTAEGSVMAFTVALLPASGQTVTVNYATANGSAVAPGDYTAKPSTLLTFTPGQTSKVVNVTTINDTTDEIAETLLLNLTPGNGTADIADAQGTGMILDNDNVKPTVTVLQTTDSAGSAGFEFATGQTMKARVTFTDPGLADTHSVTVDWGDGTAPTAFVLAPIGSRTFERTHVYASEGFFQISVAVADADGGSGAKTAFAQVTGGSGADGDDTVGLVDPTRGVWRLYNDAGDVATEFYYGNPGDYPFMGDWDGDGIETPGLYRQSDGYVYLRNLNTQGIADIKFFFGNPGDVPIAGDFNNDGFDTVSIYRPSNQTFYIINKLGSGDQGLGSADFFYVFGNPGDKPFVGDFDGDGVETVGLHRESTGLVYFRNTHTQGNADNQFIFGDPGDQLVAGDWTVDGIDSPALYRSSDQVFYFRNTNTQGVADTAFQTDVAGWIPVAGETGA